MKKRLLLKILKHYKYIVISKVKENIKKWKTTLKKLSQETISVKKYEKYVKSKRYYKFTIKKQKKC